LESPRVGGNVSYAPSLRSQRVLALATPGELSSVALRLFSNDLQGTGSNFRGWGNYLEAPILYVGLITLLTAPQFLVSLKKRPRRVYLGLTIICIVGLMFPYWRSAFWGFTGNYYRTFSFFVSLLILFLGVRGLSAIDQESVFRTKVLVVTLG